VSAQPPSRTLLLDALKDLIEAKSGPTTGGTKDATQEKEDVGAEVANPLGLFEMVKDAIARFRSTVTWIVGAFAAVWVVLAGTAPFAGLGDLSALEKFLAALGLLLAGLGAVLGIYAASRVLEPEDASLGELKLRKAASKPTGFHPVKWPRWELAEKVENEANSTMWQLFNAESDAYFGTDENDDKAVSALIERLESDAKRLREKREAAATTTDDAARKEADGEVAAAQIAYDDSLARRERTLAVAVTYEVRGKYLSARRMLLLGALCVLLGTLLYLLQVAAKDSEAVPTAATTAAAEPQSLTPVRVRLQPETWVGLDVTAGQVGCVGGSTKPDQKLETPGYLRANAAPKGPWEVLLPAGNAPACRPVEFTLEQPDGRVVAAR
jgi:hypothetical protein